MHMTEKEFKEFEQNHPTLAQKQQYNKYSKKNKYKNTKVYIYGGMPSYVKISDKEYEMVFDSIKEFHRWNELKTLEKAGEISKLERQKKFVIQPAFKYKEEKIREIAYKADFFYQDNEGGFIVEDVKGFDKKKGKFMTTEEFNLKWKLLKAKYPEYVFKLV